jgi:hypothetical protein
LAILAIEISDFRSVGRLCYLLRGVLDNPGPRCNAMNELERSLNQVLQEHQHESGLHMIGGQRRLVDRLVQFFEERRDPLQESITEKDQHN